MNLGVFGDSRADLVSPFVAVSMDVSDITLGEQAVNTFLESKRKAGVSLTKDVLVKWVSYSERQQRGSINQAVSVPNASKSRSRVKINVQSYIPFVLHCG